MQGVSKAAQFGKFPQISWLPARVFCLTERHKHFTLLNPVAPTATAP